jgi:Flp pilus assembly pilin Flp
MSMVQEFKRFLHDESGPELVEWAVVTIILLVATVLVLRAVGEALNLTYTDIQAWIDCVRTGSACPQ